MRLLLRLFLAAPAAILLTTFSVSAAEAPFVDPDAVDCSVTVPSAVDTYAAVLAKPGQARAGRHVAVAVDLAASPGFGPDAAGRLRYRMAFNNVAEGWSWQPQSRPEDEDYYRWKFFPLQSVEEARASYVQEEKIGEPQRTEVKWRYDYFLAFDNPYAFYRREADDDAGFSVPVSAAPGSLRLVAVAVLGAPALAESTTFWKAVHARPVDFTLKKRYLVGRLEALLVCDAASGKTLARIGPPGDAAQR